MRALPFHDALDVRIDEVELPAGPLTGSQVPVRSVLCGICGTDLVFLAADHSTATVGVALRVDGGVLGNAV
jgi:threonine dehydrogenase-like Zn-dependent dehydrogenase